MTAALVLLITMLIATASGHAEEKPVSLREAPGQQAVEENCASCHSLDYLRTTSPCLDRKGWQAEVTKMISVFGAPVAPEAAKMIVDYLSANYGIGG